MSARAVSLLLVEDNPGDARLLQEALKEAPRRRFSLVHVDCMRQAIAHLREYPVGIILLDLGLPDASGIEAVREVQEAAPRVPLVVLTGLDDDSLAVRALQEGAQDYLVKDQIESRGLLRALRYAIERKQLEDALFSAKERAEVTLNCIADAVACSDMAVRITFLNGVAQDTLGWCLADAAGRPATEILRIVETDCDGSTLAQPAGAAPGSSLPGNRFILRRDGTRLPIEESVATIRDRAGRPTGAVMVFRDISAVRAMALEAARASQHDYLTGLPNRLLLNQRIHQAVSLAKRHRKRAALAFLDLDGFKTINDTLGHTVGDEVLRSVAARLVECGRASDTVSRLGGDEFVVLLAEIEHAEDAAVAARRMLQAISRPHLVDGHDVQVSTSIGVSIYPEDGPDAETLISHADAAMYQAKKQARASTLDTMR